MGLNKNVQPLSPREIMEDMPNIIPPVVIQAVNNLLKKKYRGQSATIKTKELLIEIRSLGGPSKETLYADKSFDFESIFRAQGWKVKYDQPSYGDSNYDAYYEFTPKK
tara:strand:- start:1310 stop:1633 length:324 start_codon:yes stop_codon:yes gene_type:complete